MRLLCVRIKDASPVHCAGPLYALYMLWKTCCKRCAVKSHLSGKPLFAGNWPKMVASKPASVMGCMQTHCARIADPMLPITHNPLPNLYNNNKRALKSTGGNCA